ncbi:SGNH/GDSL hydrolase family protein [Vagococcus sp. BWB3-3]|uniref:SGNH/GDSL hydrolase family protein n=1 Tax=Vagococcus allomyrinae TaxID=2794353 RepID=A0A940SRA4_9ENTE|nr:SGNH/GDSL hydrolase family protein [Vagococcus allomyrinae]MBP1040587.1 SGNH/GDSL hydrolase family protein [Vagococcus allomyrinae]
MKLIQKYSYSLGVLILACVIGFMALAALIPKAQPMFGEQTAEKSQEKQLLNFAAIGDSLTEGVGDTTKSGGYVPLLKQAISEETGIDAIHSDNFGKAGDRSDQILKRIKKNEEIQTGLKEADFITLTVGGNDLMKVVKSEFMNDISYETFDKPLEEFKKQLGLLIAEIRSYNSEAPIYLMGIYNPFYLSFQEVSEMQDIVTLWNDGAKEAIKDEQKVYFIPINDSLYKGLNGQIGIGSDTTETSTSSSGGSLNNLISEVDNFHPNNLGYQIMANAFKEKMFETKKDWLEK